MSLLICIFTICIYHEDTVSHVMVLVIIIFQAGLITLEEPFWLGELRDDPVGLGKKLARQKPYWKPGNYSKGNSHQ